MNTTAIKAFVVLNFTTKPFEAGRHLQVQKALAEFIDFGTLAQIAYPWPVSWILRNDDSLYLPGLEIPETRAYRTVYAHTKERGYEAHIMTQEMHELSLEKLFKLAEYGALIKTVTLQQLLEKADIPTTWEQYRTWYRPPR